MNIRRDFPREISVIEHTWIPLQDGTRLAARIWLPVDAEANPVPALLEYLPYRKNDMTAWRDSIRHPYLAGHGYASVRVDIRGNGDSDGLMLDEYTEQEQSDCLEVLEWLDAQPWCTGKVGMFGKSWGGFNALQIAALRPPQLKAIITIASTDDRYADDVHYMGGCLLGSEMLPWASTMLCYNASPPDPRVVGNRWRDLWRQRLEQTPPFVEAWFERQRRDAFWKHGSVCEDFAAIECAVYAVGGWADGYTNAVPRLLEGLSAPKKGLIGPWAHNFPENSAPMPAIGFLQESVRWWDHWLKGIDSGIMDEPMLRSWIQESYTPSPNRAISEGYWVVDPSWPSPNVERQQVPFDRLVDHDPGVRQQMIGQQVTGVDNERWLGYGVLDGYAGDQRADNGRSICFSTMPAQDQVTILGFPEVALTIQVDQPQASLAVRLCDVAPDGTSTLVSWGLFNLSHRNSHEKPEAVPTNEAIDVNVPLNVCGHRLAAGHRWQVVISPTYWPHLWPSPVAVTLTIEHCALFLPIRSPSDADTKITSFAPPECAEPLDLERIQDGHSRRQIEFDRLTNRGTIVYEDHDRTVRFPDGLIFEEASIDTFQIVEGDPLSATVSCSRSRTFERDAWQVEIETQSRMSCDANNFYLTNQVTARERSQLVFERTWNKTIARDYQ
ncbi:CocE/NonD family hydrolase [Chloroflexi bacterium TSY]|nr:CocE/NonD family hydrolase [Chloroflexi bacterium TSY]